MPGTAAAVGLAWEEWVQGTTAGFIVLLRRPLKSFNRVEFCCIPESFVENWVTYNPLAARVVLGAGGLPGTRTCTA